MMLRSCLIAPVLALVLAWGVAAQDKKADKPATGSVTGTVTGKGDAWIEVASEGQTRSRRYATRWKDPGDAAKLKDVQVGAQVKLEFTVIDSRPRVDKIEVVAAGKTDKKPEPEKKPAEPEPKKSEPPKKTDTDKKTEPKKPVDPPAEKKPTDGTTAPSPRVKM